MFVNFNWIDIVIIIVTIFFVFDGWERGLVAQFANLLAFLASLWLAIRYHVLVGAFITQKFGITATWADVIGYLLIAFASEIILEEIIVFATDKLPQKIAESKVNHVLGGALSVLSGLVTISFFLLLFLAFPIRGSIKKDITASPIAKFLVNAATMYGGGLKPTVDRLASEATKFITIEPGSNENVPMNFPILSSTLPEDSQGEADMLVRVNRERTQKGLSALTIDTRMVVLARAKSRDMFARNYFAHTDPDGKSVANHMEKAEVEYRIVGENLAYAPDTETAHNGLMNSPGHRANIMDTEFRRVGIGVIDGGIYGKMYTQIFAD